MKLRLPHLISISLISTIGAFYWWSDLPPQDVSIISTICIAICCIIFLAADAIVWFLEYIYPESRTDRILSKIIAFRYHVAAIFAMVTMLSAIKMFLSLY